MRLFHASKSEKIAEIRVGGPWNLFDGIFCSSDLDSAESHGSIISEFEIDEAEIMRAADWLALSTSQIAVVEDVLKRECAEGADIERAYEIIERADVGGAERELEIFGAEDAGSAGWEAQRIRGRVANALGYRAVEIEDEHGTSTYLLVRI